MTEHVIAWVTLPDGVTVLEILSTWAGGSETQQSTRYYFGGKPYDVPRGFKREWCGRVKGCTYRKVLPPDDIGRIITEFVCPF